MYSYSSCHDDDLKNFKNSKKKIHQVHNVFPYNIQCPLAPYEHTRGNKNKTIEGMNKNVNLNRSVNTRTCSWRM